MELPDIKLYALNAKKHPDKQIESLAKVIKEVGWRQPIVVNQQGVIIVGHGRWMVYEKHPELNPWIIDDKGNTINGAPDTRILTEEQEKMWRIADNQLNIMTGFDFDLLGEGLKDLDTRMVELTGFDKFDLDEIYFKERLKSLGKDKDKFHSPNDPGWEDSQNPDGINELVGYDLLSVWDVVEDVNTRTGKYFLPLPLNEFDKSRNRIRYSRTHPNELEKIVTTYMREGNYFLESCVGWASFSSVAKFYGYSGVGVDIWDVSLEFSRKQLDAMPGSGKVDLMEMDAVNLQLEDNKFDFVYCNPPFFNLEGYKQTPDDISVNDNYDEWLDKIKKLSSECYRVLKPDGLAVFTMADFRVGGYLVMAHSDWSKISQETGFKLWDHAIQKIKSMSIVTRKRNYERRQCVKGAEHILVFKKVV